jgi:hypothetical protein
VNLQFSEKMVEFSQTLEPSFENMVLLPRKEGSETYVFQDLGEPSAPVFQANQVFYISEDSEKVEDSVDNFPESAAFGDDTVSVTVVRLEDILESMKDDSRFVVLQVQIVFSLVESSLCPIVSFDMLTFSIYLIFSARF